MSIDWNLLIASFSAIVASVASIATFLGWKENRELRKAQTDPFVDIKLETVDYHISLFRLKITNMGKGGAFNLRVSLIPHSSLDDESTQIAQRIIDIFNDSKFMKEGINYLASLDYKNTRYLNFYEYGEKAVTTVDFFNTILIARVEFNDLNGKSFFREYEIDASELGDTYKLGKSFEESVPQSLEKMQKDTHNINQNLRKYYLYLERKFNEEKNEWTELELQRELLSIKFKRERDKKLGRINKTYNYKKLIKKPSIHELRKQNQ
ncbi:hypothetical protein D7V21_07265 [Acinetobacter guerrae]|uniref:Uncharacterized protein n=1 Tax=Acinetobacter guerrae TaxID=1843371 RepID=A0A3A8EJ55_9GAMM|nr:hypothetical protein [Acinetobacter guerrae]RKG34189.1 hypothetical protein D7V21_07265 [Acinetobacter guerrae]